MRVEALLPISYLNDFIFCPRSIYFHQLYSSYKQELYHDSFQTQGKLAHASIEEGTYSSEKRYLMDYTVYSAKYNLTGKIDIYDQKNKQLIERKRRIKTIYDGYRYQLYAQYFCLEEMGYKIKQLFLHSLTDNKRYAIELPDATEIKKFEMLLQQFATHTLAEKFVLVIMNLMNV